MRSGFVWVQFPLFTFIKQFNKSIKYKSNKTKNKTKKKKPSLGYQAVQKPNHKQK